MSDWIEDPRDGERVWWPICQECDTDAVTLRFEQSDRTQPDGSYLFWCQTHSRLGDVTIDSVRRGNRPPVQDRAWRAAWAAIQGVMVPDDEELACYDPHLPAWPEPRSAQ